jgi:hypothetical protein
MSAIARKSRDSRRARNNFLAAGLVDVAFRTRPSLISEWLRRGADNSFQIAVAERGGSLFMRELGQSNSH